MLWLGIAKSREAKEKRFALQGFSGCPLADIIAYLRGGMQQQKGEGKTLFAERERMWYNEYRA